VADIENIDKMPQPQCLELKCVCNDKLTSSEDSVGIRTRRRDRWSPLQDSPAVERGRRHFLKQIQMSAYRSSWAHIDCASISTRQSANAARAPRILQRAANVHGPRNLARNLCGMLENATRESKPKPRISHAGICGYADWHLTRSLLYLPGMNDLGARCVLRPHAVASRLLLRTAAIPCDLGLQAPQFVRTRSLLTCRVVRRSNLDTLD
jgi:hypothetical protein